MATFTALGTGGNTPTWTEAASSTRASVSPAGSGTLIAIGYVANDSGATSGGTVANSGWSGTAPSWSTPVTVHNGSAVGVGLVVAYATNAYTGSGGVTLGATGANLVGATVVEITGVSCTFSDDASAGGASTVDLNPQGDLMVAAFLVASTTDHSWTNATEMFDANDTLFGVIRASFATDDTSPADPSATPNTGNRVMVGLSFTTGEAPATHPSVAFTSSGAGAGTETSSAQLALACPATVNAGDILVAHVMHTGTTTGPTDPSGWTLLSGPNNVGVTTPTARHWAYGKLADGSEDGATVNFGTDGGTNGRAGRIYSYRLSGGGPPPQGTPVNRLCLGFTSTAHDTDPQGPTVTTLTKGGLAVALMCQDDNNTPPTITGMSGGTWAEDAEFVDANLGPQGLNMSENSCVPTSNPGTVSGGAQVATNDESGTIGFWISPYPLVPAVRPVRRQRLQHPLYH